jgi:tetratricopeptide (TPR) repeat protein/DNA-binding SARP family transcriptional activator
VEFVILGRTSLRVNDRPISLGAAKQRAMLALLLYHVRLPVRAETILKFLWVDQQFPSGVKSSLYALASRNRQALKEVGLGDALVRVDSIGAYRLDVDPALVDYHRFNRLVSDARAAANRHRDDTVVALLTEATGLWTDAPLADLHGREAEILRTRMTDALLDAHKLLAASELRLGDHKSVLARLEPFLVDNCLDEPLAQYWITALCADGRPDEARTFSARFRRRFKREMKLDSSIALPGAPGPARPPQPRAVTATHSPPARSVPRQLPKDIADFSGHGALFAEIDTLTGAPGSAANVIVIAGMPGIGKTTLAVHWANQRRARFPDGQLFLNANAFGAGPGIEPGVALGRFLAALGVPPESTPAGVEERRNLLDDVLAERRMVIVLDNVRDSSQARQLTTAAPHCVTLITSRNKLRGLTIRDGARCVTVPPLAEPDSVALLRRLIGPRASTAPSAVQSLARLASGLPLALRIVGVHVAEQTQTHIADLVDELDRHLLRSESDDDEEASLERVFSWSYDALAPEAARLFRLLSWFPGTSFSPEAAAAMFGADPSRVQSLLNILARANLVDQAGIRRYRFHDLLLRYAGDMARANPPDSEAAATRRLLDWFLLSANNATRMLAPNRLPVPDLPESVGTIVQQFDSDIDAMRWCERERGNIVAVTRHAVTNGFHRHGWQLPGIVHEAYDRYGRQDDILELCALALCAARRDGHRIGEMGTLINEGATYFALRRYEPAAESFAAALGIAREIGDADAEATCMHNLASVHVKTGNAAEALAAYGEVLAICRRTSNIVGEGSTLYRLGTACRQMGRYQEAFAHYREALSVRERGGVLREQGKTHAALAALCLETADPASALDHARRAISLAARAHDDVVRCEALTTAADAQRELADYEAAVRDGEEAVALSEDAQDPVRRSRALTALAGALAALRGAAVAAPVRARALRSLDGVPEREAALLRSRLLGGQ